MRYCLEAKGCLILSMHDDDRLRANRGSDISVCVLAYNEEKHIERTLSAIVDGSEPSPFAVHVYANGCTDRTVEIARRFAETHANVFVREIPVASKPYAWNTAFAEQQSEFLIFADGDIVPEPGAVTHLVGRLKTIPHAVIASCRQVPLRKGLNLQQKLVGFMQMPLLQDFLAGGFYAVRRQTLAGLLAQLNYDGLPAGVTGEDCFLDNIAGHDRLLVAECCSAYEPPSFSDYCRYLARIRWQNEQLGLLLPNREGAPAGLRSRLAGKLRGCRGVRRLLVSLVAVSMRCGFKLIAFPFISRIYRRLGPVREDGALILRSHTRSSSSR